ncbi:MAG: YchF/TatD family DNA exonuclease [Nitrospirae bacterium]|nr:MAG: YchF/TatD family DNA exonuclease [Nitrospirota bacterium]
MDAFSKDLPDVLERAKEAGVERLICVGVDEESSEKAIELAKQYKGVYATAGYHPHDAKDYPDGFDEKLRQWAKQGLIVALGEIGLDYHYDHSPREIQKEIFLRQLALAKELNLPVIIHSREAADDTYNILKESGISTGVMHCYSGSPERAERFMALGFYISISGPVTFKKAERLKKVASLVPDEYLLIETDAPYLTPSPYRGRRNEPAYVRLVAEEVARLRGVSTEDIARITSLNASRLFGIQPLEQGPAIAYKIRDSLYLNITNRCSNACSFCVRYHTDYVKGHNLRLTHEPSLEELKEAIGDPRAYREIVFCGYGEPTLRLDLIKELSRWIKQKGGRVRINTNGHGNLINKRNILPELKGIVDAVSISLDAQDEETYQRICRPLYPDAFKAVVEFIKESVRYIPEVTVTVVDLPGVDIERCRELALSLGATFRVRHYNVVG